jgi:hypothetical protein
MWQKHNIQLANFDLASLRVIWFRWGRPPLLIAQKDKPSRLLLLRSNETEISHGRVAWQVNDKTVDKGNLRDFLWRFVQS